MSEGVRFAGVRVWAVLAFAVGLQVAGPVAAQSGDGDREARGLFAAGEAAYQEGSYERAYEYFTRAYEMSGRAPLLYNMGLAADRARLDAEAIAAYESFLAAVPEHEQRDFAQRRVDALRQQIARATAEGAAHAEEASAAAGGAEVGDAAVETPEARVSGSSDAELAAGIALAGGGVAALAVGWVLWAELESAYGEFDSLAPGERGSPVFTRLQGDIATLQWSLLGTALGGGALLTTALPLLLPEADGVPWWSYVAAGAGAVVVGLGAWQLADGGRAIGLGNELQTEPAWLGVHVLAHGLPLLAVPLVYLVRDLTGDRGAGATVEMNGDRVGLRAWGRF